MRSNGARFTAVAGCAEAEADAGAGAEAGAEVDVEGEAEEEAEAGGFSSLSVPSVASSDGEMVITRREDISSKNASKVFRSIWLSAHKSHVSASQLVHTKKAASTRLRQSAARGNDGALCVYAADARTALRRAIKLLALRLYTLNDAMRERPIIAGERQGRQKTRHSKRRQRTSRCVRQIILAHVLRAGYAVVMDIDEAGTGERCCQHLIEAVRRTRWRSARSNACDAPVFDHNMTGFEREVGCAQH
jgi:hypothetical protein